MHSVACISGTLSSLPRTFRSPLDSTRVGKTGQQVVCCCCISCGFEEKLFQKKMAGLELVLGLSTSGWTRLVYHHSEHLDEDTKLLI